MTTDDAVPGETRPYAALPHTMPDARGSEEQGLAPGYGLLIPDTEDDQGVAEARAVKDAQFSAFYRAHVKPVIAFLMRQGASTAEAADIAQETMVKAYAQWDAIREPRPWAYKVAANDLAARGRARRDIPVETVPEPSALLPDPDAATEWEMRHHTLWMLSQLPDRQRQVLAWKLVGFTAPEIAEHLGITPGAVRAALMKARAAVTPHLTGRPRPAPTHGSPRPDRDLPHGLGATPRTGACSEVRAHDSTETDKEA